MRALYLHTISSRLLGPMGVALLLVGPVTISVTLLISPGDIGEAATRVAAGMARFGSFIFAAGLVGQPISSGEMVTWITRPITLPGILIARFAGVLTATVIVVLVPLLLALPFGGGLDAAMLLQALSNAVAVVATIAFFSCMLPTYGDALVTMLFIVFVGVTQSFLLPFVPWLQWPVQILAHVAGAHSDGMLDVLLARDLASARDCVLGLFRIAALLTAGAYTLTRRDFGYGRG